MAPRTRLALGLSVTTLLASLAGAAPTITIVHSTDPDHPTSIVPGLPGLRFGGCGEGFGAPAVSPDGQRWVLVAATNTMGVGNVLVSGSVTLAADTVLSETRQAPWLPGALVGTIKADYAINSRGEIAAVVGPRGRDQIVRFDPMTQAWLLEAEAGGCVVDGQMRPLGDELGGVQMTESGAVGFISRRSLAAPGDPAIDLREDSSDPAMCIEARDDLVVLGRKLLVGVGSVLVSPNLEGPTVQEVLPHSLRVGRAASGGNEGGTSVVYAVSVDPGDGGSYEMIALDGVGVASTGSTPAADGPLFASAMPRLLDLAPGGQPLLAYRSTDSSVQAIVLDGSVIAMTGGSVPGDRGPSTSIEWIGEFISADAAEDGVLVAGDTTTGQALWHSRRGTLLKTGDRIDLGTDRAPEDPTIVTGLQPGWVMAGGTAFGVVSFRKPISETEGEAFIMINVLGCVADISSPTQPGVPDGLLTGADMFHFGDLFRAGDLAADLSSPEAPGVPDGKLSAADFFFFLDQFTKGCQTIQSN